MNKISLIILISIGAMALKKVKKVSFSSSATSLPARNKLLVHSTKPISLDPVNRCDFYMEQISSNSDENTEQRMGEGSWRIDLAICSEYAGCVNYFNSCSLSATSLSFVVDSRLKPHDPVTLETRDFQAIDLGVKDNDGLEVSSDNAKCQFTLKYVDLM